MPGRKTRSPLPRTSGRPAAGNRLLLILSAVLMLAGIGVALAAGLGAALRVDPAGMPVPALAGWEGALAGAGILLLGFALSNAAQRRLALAGGWVLVAAGVGASLLARAAPALGPALAAAGALLVGWQFARRLRTAAPRRG